MRLTQGDTYFVIVVDDSTIKLAGTQQDAITGSAIDLLSAGTGSNHSLGALVTVTVSPEITKTTRTGGIRHDAVQVSLSSADSRALTGPNGTLIVTFSAADWDQPVVVKATAIDDSFVDGADTQVFAPHPNTLSRILGPVFVEGGGGGGSLGLTTAFLLPGETNVRAATGAVLGFPSGTEINVLTADIQAFLGSGVPLSDLVDQTLEITQALGDTALGQFRRIVAVTPGNSGETVLTLNEPFTLQTGQALTDIQKYAISSESLNFFVNETSSIDVMFVHDEDSQADSSGVLTANTLTGLNMGPGNVDGLLFNGRFKPIGITYGDLEVVDIDLGRGFNNLKVLGTPTRADGYQTWTIVHTGDDVPDPNQPTVLGDTVTINLNAAEEVTLDDSVLTLASAVNETDGRSTLTFTGTPFAGLDLRGQVVRIGGEDLPIISHTNNVLSITGRWDPLPTSSSTIQIVKRADGAFALDAGAGNDIVNAAGSTLPLVIFGGLGNDDITGGSGNDIIFGDRGRVDFFGEDDGNGNRPIVTRLGTAPMSSRRRRPHRSMTAAS